ncbi:MAG: methionyl-tRNA formyltransferase [Minisyncoccia bacterium]
MVKELNFCFFGSSDFSVYVLKNILKKYKPEVVFTLPAKRKGRGMRIEPNVVFSFALKEKLPVIEIENFNNFNYKFLFGVVTGFGKIIPKDIFKNFEKGLIGIHPSLLPKYRGANPIREVILNGEKETGVTIFLLDELVDHGPIIKMEKYPLKGNENYKDLEKELGILGGKIFNEILEDFLNNKIILKEQDEKLATYTKKIEKEDGLLKINEEFILWERKIRALNPWPGTFIYLKFLKNNEIKLLKIFEIERIDEKEILSLKIDPKKIKVGEFFSFKNYLALKIKDSFVLIKELQIEDKKRMNSREFLNGYRLGSFVLA